MKTAMRSSPSIVSFENLDQAQIWILSALLREGQTVDPRGNSTLEISPIVFSLTNPLNRCTFNPARKWNFPFALGEYCWHMTGSNQLDFIQYYAKTWQRFSDDGTTISGSCYGRTIFSPSENGVSQWDRIVSLLKKDPQTRRAVLSFFRPAHHLDIIQSKDIPCTCTLQFILRQNRLDAIGHMRSNDIIWGLPYDAFLFTMFQEAMAAALGVEMGRYTHFAGSMHIYENHIDKAEKMLEMTNFQHLTMPKADDYTELDDFLGREKSIRLAAVPIQKPLEQTAGYWETLSAVLAWYRFYKTDKPAAIASIQKLSAPTFYVRLLKNYIGQ